MMPGRHCKSGFTLVELMVVMAIIAILLTLAVPRYMGTLDSAKESVLRENLASMRDVIDKFYSDTGKYPLALDDLVQQKYLRKIPLDPITDSNRTWVITAPEDPAAGAVFDVHSGSTARARDGSLVRDW